MIKLSESETRRVERARELLDKVWNATYSTTEDMARDFGRVEVDCRSLLSIIDRMTGRDAAQTSQTNPSSCWKGYRVSQVIILCMTAECGTECARKGSLIGY